MRERSNNLQYRFFKMKNFFCTIFLIAVAQALQKFRLSSLDSFQLTPNNTIVSTLGNFRCGLRKTGCKLAVDIFDNATSKYTSKGNYSSTLYTGDCEYLNITDGKIVTDTGATYLNVTGISFNYSTIFTIDDEGVMRLIGTYISASRVEIVSSVTTIDEFQTQGNYVRAFFKKEISFMDRYTAIANERKWKFIAEFGQLTIYYGEDPGIKIDYIYSSISIRDSNIYDFSNRTFPASLFNNITFEPRCAEPKIYLDFKPPFVFVVDPYWPRVSVYEQGGYRIFDVSYFNLPQYDYQQNITEVNYHHFRSPCPLRTFEHLGDCLASCPQPYYHQIKGETGRCVLVCEEFSSVNETDRTCNCVTQYEWQKLSLSDLVIGCPSSAQKTPYGCACKNSGEYYDGKLSFRCVKECPNATVGYNGLCMGCPFNCLACQRDGFNRMFFECTACREGYQLVKAQCVKSCLANYGMSVVSGECRKCNDARCADCSNDPAVCLKCSLLTTLENGTCKDNCTAPARPVYSEHFATTCLKSPDNTCSVLLPSYFKGTPFLKCDSCFNGIAYADKCVQACPAGYFAHNNKYCACDGVKNLTIHDQCFQQVACPISMYFDILSHSCLSCPYGCLSCYDTKCTSCKPGYFLYVSPQIVFCRRKSPLFPCDGQYSWQRNTTCLVTNFTNPELRMTECVQKIANCQVCQPASKEICLLCVEGFYIYNNTCIGACPSGMVPHDNTCILTEIVNCSVPHLQSVHQSTVVTLLKIRASKPYAFYTYDNNEPKNDPVGFIPVFQDLTSRTNDGIPRGTEFFDVQWVCLKCNSGYGLASDFKSCLPCPAVCEENLCYMARNDSCLKTPGKKASCSPGEYLDTSTGECLQSCSDPSKYPELIEGQLLCQPAADAQTRGYMKIDSAIYRQSDGSNMAFFVFNKRLEQAGARLAIKYLGGVSRPRAVGQASNSTPAGAAAPPSSVEVVDGEYIHIDEQAYAATYQGYELNLTDQVNSLKGAQSNIAFPSKVYGSVEESDHRAFMRAWLAFIGYIMSVVIILLHAVFIGNGLLYKVDNLLIFAQSIFYFSFVKNLVGRLLSQFYYGWSFSHAGFLPNLFEPLIPDHYAELAAPVSFKIVNVDGNYFRNAGFSLAWLLIYLAAFLVVAFLVWGLVFKVLRKREAWYPRVAKQALIGGFEFFSMNLVFFSVTQLRYGSRFPPSMEDYHSRSQALAIVTLSVVGLYTLLRLVYNRIAGAYMLKRFLLALFLALAYDRLVYLLPVLLLSLLFVVLRLVFEEPENKYRKATIVVEELAFACAYLLLFLCVDGGVNSIIISVLVFVFIVYLAYDLTTVYLESRDEYPEDELVLSYEEEQSQKADRARAISGGNFSRQRSAAESAYV